MEAWLSPAFEPGRGQVPPQSLKPPSVHLLGRECGRLLQDTVEDAARPRRSLFCATHCLPWLASPVQASIHTETPSEALPSWGQQNRLMLPLYSRLGLGSPLFFTEKGLS